MKVLYYDNHVDGHHLEYMKAFASSTVYESVFVLPKHVDSITESIQYTLNYEIEKNKPHNYYKVIRFLRDVARKENVDIVHFLSFDPMVKYFGLFLGLLKDYSVVVTFHHYRYSYLHDYARKRIYKRVSYGIVHTKALNDYSRGIGINNCIHIEYPVFKHIDYITKDDSRIFWGIPRNNIKVLVSLGSTRFNKGLDILLEALHSVDEPFYLLIAGSPDAFDENYINNKTKDYSRQVFCKLSYLSEYEVKMAISVADIVVLPYRKEFDGASGPLSEGVMLEKCIIGPSHGSLNEIIEHNHLGATFCSEDSCSLAETINTTLSSEFVPDESYKKYKAILSPERFLDEYEQVYKKAIEARRQ